MKQYKIAVSTCGRRIEPEEFKLYAEGGVTQVELSFRWDMYDDVDWAALKRGAEEAGVEIVSIHLPFSGEDNPAQMDEAIRLRAVERFKKIIQASAVTGARSYVIHASSEPISDEERPKQMANAKKTLAELAEFSKQFGAFIAVEDLPRTCLGRNSDEILELISAHDNLRVCFDTNHLLMQKNEDFIKAVGENIVTTHFSDYDYIDEKHWLPGMGDIDWQSLMDALDSVDYQGPVLYELYRAKGQLVPHVVTPAEYVRNAKELMERKPLTQIEGE